MRKKEDLEVQKDLSTAKACLLHFEGRSVEEACSDYSMSDCLAGTCSPCLPQDLAATMTQHDSHKVRWYPRQLSNYFATNYGLKSIFLSPAGTWSLKLFLRHCSIWYHPLAKEVRYLKSWISRLVGFAASASVATRIVEPAFPGYDFIPTEIGKTVSVRLSIC